MLQAESVRDAAWGCEWVGTPFPFVRSLSFIIAVASKEIVLTAGKFVPVSKATMMNVRYYFRCGCKPVESILKHPPSVRLCAWKLENSWTDIYDYNAAILIIFVSMFKFLSVIIHKYNILYSMPYLLSENEKTRANILEYSTVKNICQALYNNSIFAVSITVTLTLYSSLNCMLYIAESFTSLHCLLF